MYKGSCLRFKIPDIILRHPRDSVGRSSNLVFTIWAVFGGFILHFLDCNYVSVLLKPSYEDPVNTPKDLIDRDITPFFGPGREIYRQFFESSPDPYVQEISRRLYIAKDWEDYDEKVKAVISTGKYAEISGLPARPNRPFLVPEEDFKDWYRSSEIVEGIVPYGAHITNKKWPLKEVPFNRIY